MNEIMLVNPRRKTRRRRTTRRRRRRVYRRNPVPAGDLALALNPAPRRRSPRRSGLSGLVMDSLVTGAGVVGGIMLPSKVFKVTGNTKYIVQGAMALGSATVLSKLVGRKVGTRLGAGFGIALAVQLLNDLVLAPKGQSILGQGAEVEGAIMEIPEIEQEDVTEIPEITMNDIEPVDTVVGQDEVIVMPEAYELEQDDDDDDYGLEDIEPSGELSEGDQTV